MTNRGQVKPRVKKPVVSLRPAKKGNKNPNKSRKPTLYDDLKGIIGKVKGMPSDLSINHDHYLYGLPKRK